MYKILIADDHEMVREGIKGLLKSKSDFYLIGEASSGREAITLYKQHLPEIMLLDISLPDINGMDVAKQVLSQYPLANIIIFSMYTDEDYISACMKCGVKGFVIKNESSAELELAIRSVLQGKNYFSTHVQNIIFKKFSNNIRRSEQPLVTLTKREIEIIKLLTEGYTSNEMADKLFISTRTVETHRANVMKKLNAKNAIELVKKSQSMKIFNN